MGMEKGIIWEEEWIGKRALLAREMCRDEGIGEGNR